MSPAAAFGLVDQDYRYRSVATQILHDGGLALYALPAIQPRTAVCEAVILSLHYDDENHIY